MCCRASPLGISSACCYACRSPILLLLLFIIPVICQLIIIRGEEKKRNNYATPGLGDMHHNSQCDMMTN